MSIQRKINLLFIVPSLIRAGAETGVVNLLNGLDNTIFRKYLFTFQKALDQYDRLDHNYVHFFNQCRRYKFDPAPVLRIAGLIDTEGYRCDSLYTPVFSIAWLVGAQDIEM